MSSELYDIYIVEIESRKVVSIPGKNLTERRMDRRYAATLERINDKHFVADCPAGTYKVGDTYDD